LVNVKPLSDGRYDVLLLGLERYEIREQLFDRRYRQARIGVKRTSSVDGLDSRIRAELHRRLTEHLEHMDEEAPWRELLRLQIPDDILVNNLSMSLDLTPVERQFLLEADTLAQRARRLSDLIEFKQHERKDARGLG
jgi:Lon protease-like protein